MNKHYSTQLLIDVVIITLGFIIYLFPHVSDMNASIVFYTLMSIYAGLELIEYIITKSSEESLLLFFSAGVCAFSGLFLKEYDPSVVLSLTLIGWTFMVAVIKIISLEKIAARKTNLFIIKLTSLSMIVLIGILVAINIFYRISIIGYMLALVYISYGFLELLCDLLEYSSNDIKLLKE